MQKQDEESCSTRASQPARRMTKRCIAVPSILLLMLSVLVAGRCPSAVADDILLPSQGKEAQEGEESRPWRCCDVTLCSRSMPPTCQCMDVVDNCAATCKACKPLYPPRRVCLDQYTGDPGPKCTDAAFVPGEGNRRIH